MKSKVKQMLSVVLTVCMLATVVPLNAYAADVDFSADEVTTDADVDAEENVDVDISEEEPVEDLEESVDVEEENTENVESSEAASDSEEDLFTSEEVDEFSDDTAEIQSFDYESSNRSVSLPNEYIKIFHLDAGRKYFSVDQIKAIIDTLSSNGYNYMELAVGNDALRFLLDDMSVTVDGTTYSSENVKTGIQAGNKAYYNAGSVNELSQDEMDSIISYANNNGISIIPLLNSPGHMDAIIDCMESKELGMSNVAYNGSVRTINVANETVVNFTTALIKKYVEYFAGKGCKVFNMGADEYANDLEYGGGFSSLISGGNYGYFVKYVNSIAAVIKNAGMVPMAFNDGIYYNGNTSGGIFDSDIAVSYWTAGWGSGQSEYTPASASFLAGKGHKIINTNDAWYYVLGRQKGDISGCYTIATATEGVTGTKYNNVPGNNDPTPVGSMICVWCDTPSVEYSTDEQNNVNTLIETFANNNQEIFAVATPTPTTPAEATPTPPANDVVTEPNTKINFTVGEDTKVIINGVNYTGQEFATDDSSIATVKVTDGADAKKESTKYQKAESVTYAMLISEDANSWKSCENYYYQATDGNYYPLYAKRSRNRKNIYSYTWGYLVSTDKYETITTDSNISSPNSRSPSITVYTQFTTEATEAFTEFTFTGVSVGTTYVQIGDVRYTINVLDKAPSNAITKINIKLEYWITNVKVYDASSVSTGNQVKTVSSTEANSDEGIAIADIAPNPAYSFFDGTKEVYYWQAMRLDADHKQTEESGVDQTTSGTTITHIRYTNAWQYKTADGTWHYFASTDQLVAYYLQKTEVTKDVNTYAKDWGYTTGKTTDDTSSGNGQVALTVAVVYPDGTVSPAKGSMYADSTTIFNYWDGRDIGIVAPQNNSNYTIEKITVTDGKRVDNSDVNVWYTNDRIEWEEKKLADGETDWYDETTVWDDETDAGTTPMVNGKKSNIVWSAKNTAKLVLIYLKPIKKDTNLTVRYEDNSQPTAVKITEYQIVMQYNQGDLEPTFLTKLNNGTKKVQLGIIDLDDAAYVVNVNGTNQEINKNLVKVPAAMDPKYRSGAYTYVSAEIVENGKTLILHYNLDSTKTAQYIVDFGEPVKVPVSDLVDNATEVENVTSTATNISVKDETENGTTIKVITFTPDEVMTDEVVVTVTITYKQSKTSVDKTIEFIPASTVYYEEGYASSLDQFSAGNKGTVAQKKEKVSEPTGNYGYDDSYKANAGASSGMAAESQAAAYGATATFNFTGTGVDIYANCTKQTSPALVAFFNSNGERVKMYTVDTKVGGNTENATKVQEQIANAYSVPIVSVTDLTYGSYTVKIAQIKSSESRSDGIKFDGFRVYNTLSESKRGKFYAADELDPYYVELRNKVLAAIPDKSGSIYADKISHDIIEQVYTDKEQDKAPSAVIVDSNEEPVYTTSDLQDLLDNGSKNELYLYKDQSLIMELNNAAQIGLKGVDGIASYTLNESVEKAASTTDMFYPVSKGKVIITNTSDVVLSITKLKVCGGVSPTSLFAPLTEESLTAALVGLGYEKAPAPTAKPTATPTQKPVQQIKLATPKLGKVVSAGYNALKLNWSKVNGADGYRVYVKVNGQWKALGNTKSTTYVHKKLETGKSYTYTVKAYKNTKSGTVWSSYDKKGITGKAALSAPSLRKAKRTSAKKATLSWKKVNGASGYVVYRKTNNGRWQIVKKITKGNITSFTDKKLSKSKKYTYTVRAYRTVGKKNIYSGYNKKGLKVK